MFSKGVTTIKLMKTGDILVGAGDGTVAVVKVVKTAKSKEYKRIR